MNLEKYNQKHLLNFYNELTEEEKNKLNNDIKKIDFNFINNLYEKSFFNDEMDINKVTNLKCIHDLKKIDIEKYNEVGEELIKNNKYAVVIMAGGSASRLGLNKTKGCLELNINNKKTSLFEIYINQLKEVYTKYGIYISLYIMTNKEYYNEIISFFKENNYFDYPHEKINIFLQNELPILDVDGKILLKNKYSILFGPNGNGDVFESMKKNNIIKKLKDDGIEYVLFSTVDNILVKLVDFSFIGSCIYNNYKLATKTILKKDPNDKNWVFCKYNNHPSMLKSRYITEEISNIKRDNDYIYRDTNITYHMIHINEIEKYSNINLKYHRAYKKNNYLDLNGHYVKANEANSFKFEKFIFDAFEYSSDMLLYRVNESEFCPIKNYDDIIKVENLLNSKKNIIN